MKKKYKRVKPRLNILHGDCIEQMKTLPDNSVDAVVTDPPYGLSFMGKKWDYDVPSVEVWKEVLRVLKPGGHLLSFGGTRTYHRLAVNIEDAGFEIRDQVMWVYGSGFPKSHNISKAIDKMAGVERKVFGENPNNRPAKTKNGAGFDADKWGRGVQGEAAIMPITAPATPEAKQWDGWGSALKPANEPICLARKPLEKGLTLAENVLKWGTGGINIDGTRIGFANDGDKKSAVPGDGKSASSIYSSEADGAVPWQQSNLGRWPANVLFDEEAAKALGEPSRFFYVAKASKRERNAGLEGMPENDRPLAISQWENQTNGSGEVMGPSKPQQNFHPTVKPIKLMEYLITLITPPNGTVLDPFMGSGSTGVAAKKLNRKFIGIEREREYIEIAKKRIEAI